jgi:hypothetical protein
MTSLGDVTAWMRQEHRRSSDGRLVLAAAEHDHAGVFFDPGPV